MQPVCLVGRDAAKCDVVFPSKDADLTISRVHAEFRLGGGSWNVNCLGDGGMLVNGKSVRKDDQYPLRFGDTLRMGKTDMRFVAP
jgi:pSer/pThr/pTyr-binding forkhead associated (FHA) protein